MFAEIFSTEDMFIVTFLTNTKGCEKAQTKYDLEERVFVIRAGRAHVAPCRTSVRFQQVAGKRANK